LVAPVPSVQRFSGYDALVSGTARRTILASVAALFVLGYFVLLLANTCRFAAGPDSSGYLNEARLLLSGRTAAVVEPLVAGKLDPSLIYLFTPYGFARGPEPGTMVPTYPVGTPLHLAAAAAVGGWSFAPFVVGPLAASASLFLLVTLARRLGAGRGWAIVAAVLLAAFPVFILEAVQPVSDVLATFWALLAIVCALRAEEHWRWAVLSGVAFAIGVAVRPTNILMVLPLLAAMRFRLPRLAVAGLAALPFAVALMAYHAKLYGSPFVTGYGGAGGILSFGGAPPCAGSQASFLASLLTPLVFPAGLLAVFSRRWNRWERALLLTWFGVFFLFYSFYSYCPDFASTRFLLPALPPLLAGFARGAGELTDVIAKRSRFAGRALAVLLVLLLVGREVQQIGRLHVLHADDWESIFPRTVETVERQVRPDAVVLSSVLSGAFYFHAQRITVRWDQLTPETSAILLADPRFAGPWYAVVSEVEGGADALRARVPGEWREVARIRDVVVWQRF
jgi:4-amino-4-deoxy-L-arabinose transferase-like glycosyltransferase